MSLPPTLPTPVPSPCVGVCAIDPGHGACRGCWRSLDEIARWMSMSDDEKRAVWARIDRLHPMQHGRRRPAAGER